MMTDLKWKPLQQRRREHRLTLLYKIINNLVAIPKDDYIEFNTRDSRHGHSKQILFKIPDIDAYKYSYFPRTIVDWNNLKQEDVSCQTLDQFKAAIKMSM